MIRLRTHIAEMSPYALADLSAADGKPLISLSQNESAFPPSPTVARAVTKAACEAALYPDPDWHELRHAIADAHRLDAKDILCGAGSMELIGAIIRALAGPGDEVLAPAHAYAFFRTAAELSNARFVTAPEKGLVVDIDAMLAAISPKTRVVCIANPANPTGTRIPASEIRRFRDCMPPGVLLLVDEAYAEFTDHLSEPLFDLVARGDTVVTRTLSKAYGLAGLRVGWGLFPTDLGQHVRKILNPNNISGPAQAGAVAAVNDQRYMAQTVRETSDLRDGFARKLRNLGLNVSESQTNFVLIEFLDTETCQMADRCLREDGILMRSMAGYGLAHCLRATIGPREHLELAAESLRKFFERVG